MSPIGIVKPAYDINPFFYRTIKIPDKYFCDRKNETEKIINLIENGNNIVLKAQRRLGKSSLIQHIFNQAEIKNKYNTIYVDIYPTRTPDDFISLLYKAIIQCETLKGKKDLSELEKHLKQVSFELELNVPNIFKASRTSTYEILKLEKTLDVILDFLSGTQKPNFIVIDEFQQISNYKDCDIEPSLRSFMQKSQNNNFIFSGSSRHMLVQIFESPDKPFYRSCRSMTLDTIPKETYTEFCISKFKECDKSIGIDAIELVHDIFWGNTFMMQLTMNGIFQVTGKKEIATKDTAKQIIESIIDEKSEDYRTYLHGLKQNYEQVLLLIAKEGISENILSEEKKRLYGLPASTTTSNILEYFQKDESRMIEKISPGAYTLEDKFFELWAAKYIFDNLDSKFENALEMAMIYKRMKTDIIVSDKTKSKLL